MLYENESFQLNPEKMPKHVAIIMDGNGRWATKRGLPRKAGHKAGAEALERIIYAAKELGLEHLTVYAFSTENWKRSAEEVGAIMDLLRFYLKNYFKKFVKDNIRMHVIGEKSRLDTDIQKAIAEIEDLSREKNGMTVHVALNYGGRDELRRAVTKIARETADGTLSPDAITEDTISDAPAVRKESAIFFCGKLHIPNFSFPIRFGPILIKRNWNGQFITIRTENAVLAAE